MAYDGYDDGRRDFHFLYGRWAVEHRRLKVRGGGADDWDVFAGTSFTQGVMGGLCNVEENDFPDRGVQGVAFRTFEPELKRWAIYWVSSVDGRLGPPVFGRFEDGIGLFHGDDVDGDRPVKVVYRWDRITSASAHWSQAFSYDDGETWETNWTMAFTRSA